MEIDPKQAQPAKCKSMQVIRNGQLKTIYLARARFPDLAKPVLIGTNGEIIEFETAYDANEHARAVIARWRKTE
jgi:hypothetical protein